MLINFLVDFWICLLEGFFIANSILMRILEWYVFFFLFILF